MLRTKLGCCLLAFTTVGLAACASHGGLKSNDPAAVVMPPPSPTPEIYRPLVNLAVDANETGHPEEAKRRYREIIAKDPSSPEAQYCRGEIAMIDGKTEHAVEFFSAALAGNPRLETAYNDRGNAYIRLKDFDKAISDYSVAMLLGPGPVHWSCRARAYLLKKEYFKAMQDATVAINKDPKYDYAYRNRAEAWEGLKNFKQARVDYDTALEVTKERPLYLYYRAQFFMRQNEPKLAQADFLAAAAECKKPGGDYYYWASLADMKLQDYDRALQDLTRFRQMSVETHDDEDVEIADQHIAEVRTAQYDLRHRPARKDHQWAIACSAQLFRQNEDGLFSLSGEEPTEASIRHEKELLRKWWSIESREDLLSMLEQQLNDGHHSLWMKYDGWRKNPVSNVVAAITRGKEISTETARLELVREYGDKFGSRGLKAWDLCRYICLCRWGYRVGWLSEAEAYSRMMPVARELQRTYSSWQQLGEEYLVGRCFWSREQYLEDKDDSEEILKDLLTSPDSPWVTLPWNTELK